MKLYRIVPDTFTLSENRVLDPLMTKEDNILERQTFYKLEELYYKLGYTSFYNNKDLTKQLNGSNSFRSYEGKFFFLYPENAIRTCRGIVASRGLQCLNYILLEYDFPIELIAKYIGYGTYHLGYIGCKDMGCEDIVEFFIPKEEFGDTLDKSLIYIDYELRKKIYYDFLNESIEHIKSINRKIFDADILYLATMIYMYERLFKKDNYKQQIDESNLYQTFVTNKDNLVKSTFITNMMAIIDEGDIHRLKFCEETIDEMITNKGFSLNGKAKHNQELESELLLQACLRDDKRDTNKVIQLIKSLS